MPLVVACALARGRAPAFLVIAIFGATFAQANLYLVGQVPMDKLLQLWFPAIALVVLCLTVRHARRTPFAPALALIALLWYGAAALPWLQLYLNTVVLPAVHG